MADHEPMSNERLEAIRKRHNQGISLSAPDEHLYAHDDRAVLLAEVERLRAALDDAEYPNWNGEMLRTQLEEAKTEIDAMRPIVEAVALGGDAADFNVRTLYQLNYHVYASDEMRKQALLVLAQRAKITKKGRVSDGRSH